MPRWPRRSLEERFWALVEVQGPDECWYWKGAINKYGYGHFKVKLNGKYVTLRSNRLALVLGYPGVREPVPLEAKQLACHQCDFVFGDTRYKLCCNPRHLEPGDHSRNLHEAYARFRRPRKPKSLFRSDLV